LIIGGILDYADAVNLSTKLYNAARGRRFNMFFKGHASLTLLAATAQSARA